MRTKNHLQTGFPQEINFQPKPLSFRPVVNICSLLIIFALFLGISSFETIAQQKTAKKEIKYQAKIKKFTPTLQRAANWRLIGELKETVGLVRTDLGLQKTTFRGRIEFSAVRSKSGLILRLRRLELAGKGVKTKRGESGVISLKLLSDRTSYLQEGNRINSILNASLHYPLIDKFKGYRVVGKQREREPHNFLSYVEKVEGSLQGDFQGEISDQPKRGERIEFDGGLKLELNEPILGGIRRIELAPLRIWLVWMEHVFSTQNYICIQPVFIGYGPGDSTATGQAFDQLMNNAKEIWGKCCVFFWVKSPVYVNDSSYKELSPSDGPDAGSSPDEAQDLMDEYDDPDCVEVFVADRWGSYGWDGGGATWSSGQAAAQIVTVDEQLDVPCSGMRSCSSCGPLNLNHLAHELGHALNLLHPGDSWTGMYAGTAGSVLEPSGWCADNPALQSEDNCNNSSNPLIYLAAHFGTCEYNCEIS